MLLGWCVVHENQLAPASSPFTDRLGASLVLDPKEWGGDYLSFLSPLPTHLGPGKQLGELVSQLQSLRNCQCEGETETLTSRSSCLKEDTEALLKLKLTPFLPGVKLGVYRATGHQRAD